MNLSIDLRDTATPLLEALLSGLATRTELHQGMGRGVEGALKDHFASRPSNKRGWSAPGGSFWARVARGTSMTAADNSGATVTISDPAIRQKVHGGTIKPKEGKNLAIPAIDAAYGRSPRAIDGLAPMIRRIGGRPRAVALEKDGTVWYWLVKSVTQQADPDALPTEDALTEAAREAARDYLDAITAGG